MGDQTTARAACPRAAALAVLNAAPYDVWLPEASPVGSPHLVVAEAREIVAGSGLYQAVCGQTCELPPDGIAPVTSTLQAVVVGAACPACDRYWRGRMRMWTS